MSFVPIIGVTSDFGGPAGFPGHSAPHTYVSAVVDGLGGLPVIIPSLGSRLDLAALIARLDGLLVTGAPSNVHPSYYDETPAPRFEPYDEARDATTLPLIRKAIDAGLPLLAICRGMQELNVALGGSLDPKLHELPGRIDHREARSRDHDVRYGIRQPVVVEPGGCLARVIGPGEITVNSLHSQGVARLAGRLEIEAKAPDGTIEAVSVRNAPGFALGVQWHPEYWVRSDKPSAAIFRAFGEAVRRRVGEAAALPPAAPAASASF